MQFLAFHVKPACFRHNILTTSARVSSGVPYTEKQMKREAVSRVLLLFSRCVEPLMKPEARVFDMASQSICCCLVVINYCNVLYCLRN